MQPLDRQTWLDIHAQFNPHARLEVDDGDIFVERPGSVAASIARSLQLNINPDGKWVVCGSTGCGKSSELVHLERLLEQRQSHTVIGLDLFRSVSHVDRLQPAEVLFLIGAAAVRTARDVWDEKISEEAITELLSALRPLQGDLQPRIQPSQIFDGVALLVDKFLAPGARTVAAAGKTLAAGSGLRRRSSFPLAGLTRPLRDDDPHLPRLLEAVDAIFLEIRRTRSPIVLVDGLDKRQEQVRELFADSRLLAAPGAPIVYTGPITLMHGTAWAAVAASFQRERLTNIVVRDPALPDIQLPTDKVERGRSALRELIARRLRRLSRTMDDTFEPGSVDALITASGGLIRDLVHLVSRAVHLLLLAEEHTQPLSCATAEAAIAELRKEYEITLNTELVEELRHVRQHGEPSSERKTSADLLRDNYVLAYSNGQAWFEPHPILRGARRGI